MVFGREGNAALNCALHAAVTKMACLNRFDRSYLSM